MGDCRGAPMALEWLVSDWVDPCGDTVWVALRDCVFTYQWVFTWKWVLRLLVSTVCFISILSYKMASNAAINQEIRCEVLKHAECQSLQIRYSICLVAGVVLCSSQWGRMHPLYVVASAVCWCGAVWWASLDTGRTLVGLGGCLRLFVGPLVPPHSTEGNTPPPSRKHQYRRKYLTGYTKNTDKIYST